MMKLKRLLSLGLSAILLLGVLVCIPCTPASATETLTNVALGAQVSATNSYENAEGFFGARFLTDGQWTSLSTGSTLGWHTYPSDVNETTPVDITVTLDRVYTVRRIVLKPQKHNNGAAFPRDFELQASTDGTNWATVKAVTGASGAAASNDAVSAITYTITATQMKYFRIHITRHSALTDASSGAYLSGIGELELMGYSNELQLNKTALRMKPGEWDRLTVSTSTGASSSVTWSSDNEAIATIDQDGKVTSVAYGQTTLRAKVGDKTLSCTVTVDDHSMLDNLMITSFRSPSKNNLNEASYDLLKEAGFTNIQNEFNTTMNTVADNLLMAQFAYERGMDITAAIGDWDDGWAPAEGLSYEEMVERALLFSHIPGVGGYYIIDEPPDKINRFAPAVKAIKDVAPYADVHLNFLPLIYYGSEQTKLYQAMMYDFHMVTDGGYDYLMYDHYPFNNTDRFMDEASWYENLDVVREVGLKAGAKTGTFILSIGSTTYGYRRPTGDEIRFQVYSALAFGYKQLGYFCWETPHEVELGFGPAIVDLNGNPTEIYEPVKEVNHEALALGPTLMKLDCVNPYVVGLGCRYGESLPEDFFLQPSKGAKLLITHMRDPQTGEDYAFIVNRDRYDAQTVTLTPADYAVDMKEVSNQTGELTAVRRNADGTYTIELRAGAGRLFKMPEICDYTPNYGKLVVEMGENMAPLGRISAPDSVGDGGFFIAYMTDGIRESTPDYRGWDSGNCPDQTSYVMVDMGDVTQVNRVDLYGEGDRGLYFPKDFTIDVSTDGENWKTVVTVTDHQNPSVSDPVPSFTFARENARYIRVNITGMSSGRGEFHARLAEVEIYNMPGGEDNTTEGPDTDPIPSDTTPTEPDTTPESDEVITPETTPNTGSGDDKPAQKDEDDAITDDDEGCGSVVSLSAFLLPLSITPLLLVRGRKTEKRKRK